MSSFLYFLPNVVTPDQADRKKIAEFGLAYAFEADPVRAGVIRGPSGGQGTLVTAMPPERAGYYPAKQTWRKIPKGEAWIGFDNDIRPTPDGLARKTQLGGYEVKLNDGNLWTVPVARQFHEEGDAFRFSICLPRAFDLDEFGEWVSTGVLPQYRRLWQFACDWFDSKVTAKIEKTEGGASLKFEFLGDVIDSAVEALAANYRVNRIETGVLGLLTSGHAFEILDSLVDFPALAEWSKKKDLAAQDGSNSTAGRAELDTHYSPSLADLWALDNLG